MPHGFSAFNQGPPGAGMGGLGFAPPAPPPRAASAPSSARPRAPGSARREGSGRWNASPELQLRHEPTFGTTGPPGGAMMGGGGGSFGASSGFANPAPGFGAPGSPPGGAGFGRSPRDGIRRPRDAPGDGDEGERRPGRQPDERERGAAARFPRAAGRRDRPKMPVPNAPPFTAFVGNFPYECSPGRGGGFVREGAVPGLRTCAWSATGTLTARGGTSSSSRTARASRRRSPSTSATWAGGRSG